MIEPGGLRPTAVDERIAALDYVRGFAVLGIFAMNVLGFALPEPGDPAVSGGSEGLDLLALYVHDALFDGRMRGLFCMLFGAGLVLAWDRSQERGLAGALRLHRRHVVLMLFGLAHAFLLQMPGDILWDYALCAFLVWPFAGARRRTLWGLAAAFLLVATAAYVGGTMKRQGQARYGAALEARVAAGESLSGEELWTLEGWRRDGRFRVEVAREQAAERIAEVRGATSWWATWWLLSDDLVQSIEIDLGAYGYYAAILGTMLLGMALFRVGILTGRASTATYLGLLALGATAAAGSAWLTLLWQRSGFSFTLYGNELAWAASYQPLRLAVALGWAALLVLTARWLGGTTPLHRVLADLGRMALTVYLLETVIGTTLFYGWGLGLYGRLGRFDLLVVTLAVWVVLAVFAVLWLRRWPQGPAEWLWRRLSYGAVGPAR